MLNNAVLYEKVTNWQLYYTLNSEFLQSTIDGITTLFFTIFHEWKDIRNFFTSCVIFYGWSLISDAVLAVLDADLSKY